MIPLWPSVTDTVNGIDYNLCITSGQKSSYINAIAIFYIDNENERNALENYSQAMMSTRNIRYICIAFFAISSLFTAFDDISSILDFTFKTLSMFSSLYLSIMTERYTRIGAYRQLGIDKAKATIAQNYKEQPEITYPS